MNASSLEFVTGLAQAAVALGGGALLARFVLGRNPVAYLLAAAWVGVLAAAGPLAGQPGAFYAAQGWALIAVAAAATAWWLLGEGPTVPGRESPVHS